MAKQSNLEKVGFERRNEHELLRNDIQKNKPYDENHPYAISREGQPLGKGTESSGHQHSIPMEYSELTKNQIRPQIDVENGGGEYDINGHPQKGGGRKFLNAINIYDNEHRYGLNSVDTEANINDGQFFVK